MEFLLLLAGVVSRSLSPSRRDAVEEYDTQLGHSDAFALDSVLKKVSECPSI